MTRLRLLCIPAALLLAAAGAVAQSTAPARPEPALPSVEDCFVLGRDDLMVKGADFEGLKQADLLRRLGRQIARDASLPGVKAMLGCIMRRTAE